MRMHTSRTPCARRERFLLPIAQTRARNESPGASISVTDRLEVVVSTRTGVVVPDAETDLRALRRGERCDRIDDRARRLDRLSRTICFWRASTA